MANDDRRGAESRTVFGTPAPVGPRTPPHGTPTQPVLAPGLRVRQYELIRELGRGGMGVVFAARDIKLGRRVAIKFVSEATREITDRFLIEARATAQCNHENIVVIHEVDEYRGLPYMVLELLEGWTVRELLGAGELPVIRALDIALKVARALSRAHELGIIHRDLKPENVFVTTTGQIKVLDFGIAKALGQDEPQSHVPLPRPRETASLGNPRLTSINELIGTIAYMAPEQLGIDTVDHRIDLWALGIVLFEMLSGRHPLTPMSYQNVVDEASSPNPMPSIHTAIGGIPEPIAQVVARCLAKAKTDRMATADELVATLEPLVGGRRGRTLAEGESPYPGLTAFQEADADRFFGRDAEVSRAVTKIRELPLIGIVGPSGVGKSSFVRAGVGPALKGSGEHWDVVSLRPGRHPIAALAAVVDAVTGPTEIAPHDDRVARLRDEPGYFGTLLRNRARTTNTHVLVFVDQLEELYTLVADVAERRAFTEALTAAADDASAPLRVVVSMRSDFLERVAEDPRFADELTRGLMLLATPDRASLREALIAPIEQLGYRFETAAMVDDMLDALDATASALPLLQFTASKLWDTRDRTRQLLTAHSYASLGGLVGALAAHADHVVHAMNPAAQRLAQRIFRRLVTVERTRAIVELADLDQLSTAAGDVTRVIDQLVAARLLVVQTRGDGASGTVELVHESLIAGWPTLRRWLDEDQEDAAFVAQLATAAKQWDARARPPGLLWRGDDAEEARRWLAARPRELGARDRAFVDAVIALARRGQRIRRIALVGAFAVLTAVAAGAIVAMVSINRAKDAALANQTQAEVAAKRANDALAEARQHDAERRAAEAQQSAAEAERRQAEQVANEKDAEVREKSAEVDESREALIAKNASLLRERRDAELAKQRAEAATKEAEKSKQELTQALERERARVKKLEDERKKLSTTLKE